MLGSEREHRCVRDAAYHRGDLEGQAITYRGETNEGVVLEVQEKAYFESETGEVVEAQVLTFSEVMELVKEVYPWAGAARKGTRTGDSMRRVLIECPYLSVRSFEGGYPRTYWGVPDNIQYYLKLAQLG
jgi:hypothetical protein